MDIDQSINFKMIKNTQQYYTLSFNILAFHWQISVQQHVRRLFLFNSLPHEYRVSQIFWCSTRTWNLFSFSKLSLLKWSVICWLAFQFLISCAVCNYYHNIYYFNDVVFYFRLIFIKKLCNYEESRINISLN